MIIKTKEFKEVTNTILLAVNTSDAFSTNLGITVRNNCLYLSVTNKEYYVTTRFSLESAEDFNAVVEAPLFLDLISGINTETFTLEDTGNVVVVKVGKSAYKLPKIYENDTLLKLPVISIANKTVEMTVPNTVLRSILNVNSKEILKAKTLDVSELQRLYYITNEGCFTFTTGACLNSFTLEKPIAILVNDRIVKLFKLFKDDVMFSYGNDMSNGKKETKICLQTENTYLAAIINNEDELLKKVVRPCIETKNMINTNYSHKIVLAANVLSAALNRLAMFAKNTSAGTIAADAGALIKISGNDLTICLDNKNESTECLTFDNASSSEGDYSMIVTFNDLKSVLDSCKDEYITINCGNHVSVVITRSSGSIANLIPEYPE